MGRRREPVRDANQSAWRTGPVRLADPKDPKKETTVVQTEPGKLIALELPIAERAQLVLEDLQLGVPPRRIDIINRADGITFAEAIADAESFTLEGCDIPVIGRSALIKNKRAAGRPQDIPDVKALGDE